MGRVPRAHWSRFALSVAACRRAAAVPAGVKTSATENGCVNRFAKMFVPPTFRRRHVLNIKAIESPVNLSRGHLGPRTVNGALRTTLPVLNSRAGALCHGRCESFEQVITVHRAGGCFGVVLNGKNGLSVHRDAAI